MYGYIFILKNSVFFPRFFRVVFSFIGVLVRKFIFCKWGFKGFIGRWWASFGAHRYIIEHEVSGCGRERSSSPPLSGHLAWLTHRCKTPACIHYLTHYSSGECNGAITSVASDDGLTGPSSTPVTIAYWLGSECAHQHVTVTGMHTPSAHLNPWIHMIQLRHNFNAIR